jgi:capsular exopolysaccharide synthesis family protein
MENNPQHNIYQEESIDIKKYLFKFLANWYWFAIALSVSLAVAYMVNRYSESTYTISSSLVIGTNQAESGSINALLADLGMNRRRLRAEIVNEIAVLKSYSLARETIEALDFGVTYISVGRREIAESKMYNDCPFVAITDTIKETRNGYPINVKILSKNEYLLEINDTYDIKKTMHFGEKFSHPEFNLKINLKDPENYEYDADLSNKYYFYFNDFNSLAKTYRAKLSVEPNSERGSILTLKINGFVPEKMATYLNKLAETYIQSDLNEQNKQAQNTIKFIEEQLGTIVESLNKTEQRLQQFRADNQIFNLSSKGSMLIEDLNILQKEKVETEMNSRYYSYVQNYLTNKTTNEPLINPTSLNISNTSLERLIKEYNTLLTKINRLNTYTNKTTTSIEILDQELNILKQNISEQIETGKNLNQIKEDEIEKEISKLQTQINTLPINERMLVNIEREYKLNNELYTFLLEKRAEAGITKASNIANSKVLDVAIPENAGKLTPKRSNNYMMALILGLGIPGSIILALDFLNTKIEDKKDIERNTRIPIIGTIGHNETQSEVAVYMDPKSGIAESFRSLRTNLQYILREKDQKVVMITSTVSGEGKTFAAVNLASIMAMANKKVLLVGLDLRKPSLHKIFDIENEIGISTFLSNQSTYESIIKETHIDNLFLAPSGPIPPNPAELIETKQMQDFFDIASKNFDYIIIDTPPLALVTDALLVSQYAHANIFMIRQRYSHKQVFDLINKLEYDQKISKINILVNDLKIPKYYGYNYGYNYGYGYGYGLGKK